MFLILDNENQIADEPIHTHTRPLPCSYRSRHFSEKSTIVWNMGASLCAGSLGVCGNLAACKRVSGVPVLGVQGFVWQSHSSNPWEAMVELYIVRGVWRRRTLGSPNHHAVFREDRFLPLDFVLWVSKLRWLLSFSQKTRLDDCKDDKQW